jgi:hypothetical protein
MSCSRSARALSVTRLFQFAAALIATAGLLAGCAGAGKTVPVAQERAVQSGRIVFSGPPGRRVHSMEEGCADDCSTEGPPPSSAPTPTPPPNFGSCRNAGGATWFDDVNNQSGCVGPGAPPKQICGGLWSASSIKPGTGHFRNLDGGTDWDGVDWITDGPGGCRWAGGAPRF